MMQCTRRNEALLGHKVKVAQGQHSLTKSSKFRVTIKQQGGTLNVAAARLMVDLVYTE